MKLSSILALAAFAAIALPTAVARGAREHGGQDKAGTQDPKPEPRKDAPIRDKAAAGATDDKKVMSEQRPSYPLKACPVSGEPLDETATEKLVKGHLVRTCCGKCMAKIESDPTAAIKKIDDAVIAAQKADYPLRTSAVSDAKLDDKAVDYVHGTRLVRLASADEVEQFKKDPKAAMAKVNKAYIDAQVPKYALKKCVVSNEEFGGAMGEPVDYLYGTKLVRFCCKDCIKEFEASPDKFVKQLPATK